MEEKEKYVEQIPKLGQIKVNYAFINDKNYYRLGQENINKRKESYGIE